MNKITQTMRFRQFLIIYANKHGVRKAAIRYKTNWQYIYRWKQRYNGTLQSLADRSHRPHSHQSQHTQEEKDMILRRYRWYKDDIIMLWDSLRKSGYKRSYHSLVRVINEWLKPEQKRKAVRKIQPYERVTYQGQREQIEAKFAPTACIVGEAKGQKFYRYTFIDEYSRFRYLEAFEEHNTYSSSQFIKHVVEQFSYAIECIQTDNGGEFTNHLNASNTQKKTLFEITLAQLGIKHKLIRPYTPRHNGKVERSHRKDNQEFYASHTFFSFDDFKKQLTVRQRHCDDFPMRPLNRLSPKHILYSFPNV